MPVAVVFPRSLVVSLRDLSDLLFPSLLTDDNIGYGYHCFSTLQSVDRIFFFFASFAAAKEKDPSCLCRSI
jgi:hypothetical protein